MSSPWFDFDNMDHQEEGGEASSAEEDGEKNGAAGADGAQDPGGRGLPGTGPTDLGALRELVPVDDRSSAVLYIVQFRMPCAPQEVYPGSRLPPEPEPAGEGREDLRGDVRYLSGGRCLRYLHNGICMAFREDRARSVFPVRAEFEIHQTKLGSTLGDAYRVTSWEEATRQPLLRFRSVWELSQPPGDGGATVVRRSIREFEQYQRLELDLGEIVARSVDGENAAMLQLGPKAQFPPGYVVFSAPATAELLRAASEGKDHLIPGLLSKRADANYICEPDGGDCEVTPLMVAVQARSLLAVRALLRSEDIDANVVCRRGRGTGELYTAFDVAGEDLAPLLHDAGALPIARLGLTAGAGRQGSMATEGLSSGSAADAAEFAAAVSELSKELRRIRQQTPEEQRGMFRRLLLQWHPDKNPTRSALATSVFQWLQQAALQAPRRAASGVHWSTKQAPRSSAPSQPAKPRPDVQVKLGRMSVMMKICVRNWAIEFFNCLIEQGETPQQLDDKGRSAIFYAVRGVRDPKGDMVDSPLGWSGLSEGGFTAYDRDGSVGTDIIGLLVSGHGADVDACDRTEMTPLMEAARFGNVVACARLVELRADAARRNSRGHTALDIARTSCPEYITHAEAGSASEIDGAWSRVQVAIDRDRAEVAAFLGRGMALGGGHGHRPQVMDRAATGRRA